MQESSMGPMECPLDLEIPNVFPSGGHHVDTWPPGERERAGGGFRHSLFAFHF